MRFDLLDEYGSAYKGAATKSSIAEEEGEFDERNPLPVSTEHLRLFGSVALLALGATAFIGVLRYVEA